MHRRLQRQQVVAKDQPIIEDVVLRHAMLGVITLFRIAQQNARLQLGCASLPIQVSSSFCVLVINITSFKYGHARVRAPATAHESVYRAAPLRFRGRSYGLPRHRVLLPA